MFKERCLVVSLMLGRMLDVVANAFGMIVFKLRGAIKKVRRKKISFTTLMIVCTMVCLLTFFISTADSTTDVVIKEDFVKVYNIDENMEFDIVDCLSSELATEAYCLRFFDFGNEKWQEISFANNAKICLFEPQKWLVDYTESNLPFVKVKLWQEANETRIKHTDIYIVCEDEVLKGIMEKLEKFGINFFYNTFSEDMQKEIEEFEIVS